MTSAQKNLQDLPDEVIQNILRNVPASTILALGATARRFVDIANEPLLWKTRCRCDFKYWSSKHKLAPRLREPKFAEWKALYISRSSAPPKVRRAISKLIESQVGQIEKLETIFGLGYDCKDTLLDLFNHAEFSPNHLAQKYWSHVALGCLHRNLALEEWLPLKFADRSEDCYERAVGAFDLFILNAREPGDLDDIHAQLEEYVSCIRTDHPEVDELTTRQKAILVAKYLLDKKWTGISEGRPYHSLDHMFLGVALLSDQKSSLPLITVIIYCYVLRQLGVRVRPCSYPWHVHAIVRPPIGFDLDGNMRTPSIDPNPNISTMDANDAMYMDPFHSSEEVPRSSLRAQLNFIVPRFLAEQHAAFLAESDAREMVVRNARNILNSPNQNPGPPLFPIDESAANYAANWASVLLPTSVPQLRQSLAMLMHEFPQHYPFDLALFETHVLPLTTHLPDYENYRRMCQSMRWEDLIPCKLKRRTGENAKPKYKVGQAFEHRRQGYIAVITGWDHTCKLGEQWMQANGVDHLPGGRNQPFYHVLVQDTTNRYVAEENIELIELGPDAVEPFPIEIGKYFKRWDPETKLFVSNLKEEYPED